MCADACNDMLGEKRQLEMHGDGSEGAGGYSGYAVGS